MNIFGGPGLEENDTVATEKTKNLSWLAPPGLAYSLERKGEKKVK